jgi:hypothetical protein
MCDHRNPEKGPYVPSWELQENEWMNELLLINTIPYFPV